LNYIKQTKQQVIIKADTT